MINHVPEISHLHPIGRKIDTQAFYRRAHTESCIKSWAWDNIFPVSDLGERGEYFSTFLDFSD